MNNYSGGEWQFWQFLRVKNKRPRLITMGWMKKKKEKRKRKKKKKRKDDNRTFENDRRKNRSIYEQNLIIVSVAAKDDQE